MKLALLFALVACKGDGPSKPSQALVDGVRGLCATGELNPAEAAQATADWIAEMKRTQNKEIGDLYLNMTDGDDAAYAKLRAAADIAVGSGKCTALEELAARGRERAKKLAATPAPGPASQELVDNMKFACAGGDAMADINPAVIQELMLLLEKDELEKLRDAAKQAGLKDCPAVELMIANKRARKGTRK